MLYSLFFIAAQADVMPMPTCLPGTYLDMESMVCVPDGYVSIELFFYIPKALSMQVSANHLAEQIGTGEIVIPDLDAKNINIEGSRIEVKKGEKEKTEKLLKDFFKTYQYKPKKTEPKQVSKPEPKKEAIPLKEEKKEVAVAEETKDCSNVSVSQSLILVCLAFIFSGLRRRL